MANPLREPHQFACTLEWTGAAQGGTRSYATYSREHRVAIAGKPPLTMSAAGVFRGDEALPNPEDLLVASLASCHFLSYVAECALARVEVIAYHDAATGRMEPVDGVMRFTEVVLHPTVVVARGADLAKARALHEAAHRGCFIASSVGFPVRHEATVTEAP